MAALDVGRGLFAIVDDEDLPRLGDRRWFACAPDPKYPQSYYAMRKRYDAERKREVTVWMHRLLTNCPRGLQVDHIDRNGLHNSKSNLRICTPAQNSANSGIRIGQAGYRGVQRERKRFLAVVYDGGTPIRVGMFDDPVAAAIARDKAAIELYGEFATLNFPAQDEAA